MGRLLNGTYDRVFYRDNEQIVLNIIQEEAFSALRAIRAMKVVENRAEMQLAFEPDHLGTYLVKNIYQLT